MRRFLFAPLSLALLLLAGCDQLGIESATVVAQRKEAEGKAIGAGCRHAARSVEQCYANNKRGDKAAIFAGWKEMNDYMRENSMQAMPETPDTEVAAAPEAAEDPAEAASAGARPERKAPPKPARR